MSVNYIAPQRISGMRTTRFVRRAAESPFSGNTTETGIAANFAAQAFTQGERRTAHAEFSYGTRWLPLFGRFTLWEGANIAAGYGAISAALAADTSGRFWTATAMLDLSPGAAHPLPPGEYEGEFLLTTSAGEIVAARGRLTISSPLPGPPFEEYDAGGGLG